MPMFCSMLYWKTPALLARQGSTRGPVRLSSRLTIPPEAGSSSALRYSFSRAIIGSRNPALGGVQQRPQIARLVGHQAQLGGAVGDAQQRGSRRPARRPGRPRSGSGDPSNCPCPTPAPACGSTAVAGDHEMLLIEVRCPTAWPRSTSLRGVGQRVEDQEGPCAGLGGAVRGLAAGAGCMSYPGPERTCRTSSAPCRRAPGLGGTGRSRAAVSTGRDARAGRCCAPCWRPPALPAPGPSHNGASRARRPGQDVVELVEQQVCARPHPGSAGGRRPRPAGCRAVPRPQQSYSRFSPWRLAHFWRACEV